VVSTLRRFAALRNPASRNIPSTAPPRTDCDHGTTRVAGCTSGGRGVGCT
jgi:hypothetical protein